MILLIDTTDNANIKVSLEKDGQILVDLLIFAHKEQSEKLLLLIEKALKKAKGKFKDIKGIKIANRGGSFTSLRIGVTTANALAYALGVPVFGDEVGDNKEVGDINIVEPIYAREANITNEANIKH